MHRLFARPDHLGQVDQAFMAAESAAHLQQFADARNGVRNLGRWLSRTAYELPDAPLLAGQRMRGAIGFLDLGRQRAMRVFAAARSSRT
jgi:hypothetical protein